MASLAYFIIVAVIVMGFVAFGIVALAQGVTNPFWRTVIDVLLVIAVAFWAYAMFMPG